MLCILFLTTVGTANHSPSHYKLEDFIVKEPKKPLFVLQDIYYPVYDSGFVVDSTQVYLFEDDVKITKKMYNVLKTMLDSAFADSVHIRINSSYRTFEEQYTCRMRNVRYRHLVYDSTFLLEAESKYFRPITAKPGHSNHQKGIAFDFNTSDAEVFKWLKINAIKHGFVRTVKQERWHWEYHPDVINIYEFVKETHWSWKIKEKSYENTKIHQSIQ